MHQTNQSRMTSRKLQRGITLGETLLSMAIGAAVVVGAYTFYTKANSDVRAQQTADGISQIIVGIKDRFGPLGGYAGLTPATIVANSIVPKTFAVTGTGATTSITTPYGNLSTVSVAPDATNSSYTVLVAGIPTDACPVVIARIEATSTGLAVGTGAAVTAATSLATDAAPVVKATGLKLNTATTVAQCAAGGPVTILAAAV